MKLQAVGMEYEEKEKDSLCLAMADLAVLLGADKDDTLWIQIAEWPLKATPSRDGWLWVTDCDGGYEWFMYHDKQKVATVTFGARGAWKADAALADGRILYASGSNTTLDYDTWRE